MNNGPWVADFLPRLLRDVYTRRKTGSLRLRRGDERHGVHFQAGQIVDIESSLEDHSLPHILKREERLAVTDLAAAEESARTSGQPLAQVLIKRGVVDQGVIGDALTRLVRLSFQRIVQWMDGLYAFEEQSNASAAFQFATTIPTGEIILDLVRGLPGEVMLRSIIDDLDLVVIPSTDPLLRFQPVRLNPTEGFAYSRVDGTASTREILQLIPADGNEAARSLVALLCLGLIEQLPISTRPPQTTPSQPQSQRAERSSTPPVQAAPAASAADPKTDNKQQTTERRSEILAAHESMKTKNHFELLEIPRNATESQVKDAYFSLAKRYHPDSFSDAAFDDLKNKIQAFFMRLGEAYDVLRTPRRRAAYEAKLGAPPKAPSVPVNVPPPPPPPEPEVLLKQAQKLFKQEKFWDAIQLVEGFLARAKGRTKTDALVLLAKGYLRNPHWTKHAEEKLLKAVEADPDCIEAHYLLGSLYEDKGLRTRAANRYRRVLELNPKHEQASERLNALESTAEPEPQPQDSSLLRRILRKD